MVTGSSSPRAIHEIQPAYQARDGCLGELLPWGRGSSALGGISQGFDSSRNTSSLCPARGHNHCTDEVCYCPHMAGANFTSCVCADPVVGPCACDPRQLENSCILQAMDPKQQLLMQKITHLLKKSLTYVSAPYCVKSKGMSTELATHSL